MPYSPRPPALAGASALERYVLTYLVGPALPEWWSALFALGYGVLIASLGAQSLVLARFFAVTPGWFEVVGRMFGAVIGFGGLLSLIATHRRSPLLRVVGALVFCVMMLSYMTLIVAVAQTPWVTLWVFGMHVGLEALIMVRATHKLAEW